MPTDHIRYDLLAQAALRGVLRTVLADVAKKGLPGEHHFKITFNTTAPGVQLSDRLRAQYPQAMTIVLQYQFWDLSVHEEAFEVGLSFGGVAETIVVPFAAVTAFFDPAAQFGLQFEAMPDEAADGPRATPEAAPEPSAKATARDIESGPPAARLPAPSKTDAPAAADEGPTRPDGHSGGGEVVRLDRFRKK